MYRMPNPVVFMDIAAIASSEPENGEAAVEQELPLGRIEITLREDVCPIT